MMVDDSYRLLALLSAKLAGCVNFNSRCAPLLNISMDSLVETLLYIELK